MSRRLAGSPIPCSAVLTHDGGAGQLKGLDGTVPWCEICRARALREGSADTGSPDRQGHPA